MKRNYRLTPEVIKEIDKIAESLPKLQQMNGDKPMFRQWAKKVLGKDIPVDERDSIVKFDPKKLYTLRGQTAILTNHRVNLISDYQKNGQDGITKYLTDINMVMEFHKDKLKQTA